MIEASPVVLALRVVREASVVKVVHLVSTQALQGLIRNKCVFLFIGGSRAS